MSKKSVDNINHDAHFYGAVFGIIFTLITVKGAFFDFFLYGQYGIMNMGSLF